METVEQLEWVEEESEVAKAAKKLRSSEVNEGKAPA